MSAKGVQFIVSEYHILWEAVSNYETRLEKLSAMCTDDDQQLQYDEKLQDIEGVKKSLQIAAKADYALELR
jgi:hypothetical protein